MTKEEFKREYSKWRSFMRGQGEMHHGQKGYAVRCDASDMAFDYFFSNSPSIIRDIILRPQSEKYSELSTSLPKWQFRVSVRLNMRLPSSFRRY